MDVRYNLGEPDFQLAIGLETTKDQKPLNDPRFVRWGARLYWIVNGEWNEEQVPLKPCTSEDFARFHEVEE